MTNSQIYLDSNVLVYAFCEQPDAKEKQDKSVELINGLFENRFTLMYKKTNHYNNRNDFKRTNNYHNPVNQFSN